MIGLNSIARKIFGTQNDRELKAIQPIIARINELENKVRPLSDADLRGQTAAFKTRLERGEKLEALLPEAFATVREASRRVLGQRHYDVQMIGGIMLHRGRIAEMRTGEGKTLTCTSPCYLNALEGKGVHVVTVNDYLARRDAEWMGRVHNFLGLSVGIIAHGLTDAQRQRSYGSDITYGTNNEYGFDYLRDNMKFRLEDMVQRELHYAIVDEVDSILIDEARTPLIISGPSEQSTGLYYEIDGAFRKSGLQRDTDYTVDEKSKTASLTESGVDKMEAQLSIKNLYDPQNIETLHHIHQALRAHVLFKRDVEYVVNDGEVMIVDEFTGRLMPGRRWSDGLHQAIEAKEGVKIENENQTLATITFQNYFRMYKKLSGMTGTADTEATEFKQIYNLDVAIIPTNRPMIRKDESDLIYKSEDAKFKAIADEIKTTYDHGSPVLVGTISIEKSEKLSNLLKKQGIPHRVLNAKQHEREAEFVAQAGRKKAVTIATNMAGRGTDILLGGNAEYIARAEVGKAAEFTEEELQGLTPEQVAEKRAERLKAHEAEVEAAMQRWKDQCERERDEVKTLGGLYILGTERHESRRIDNQLRGRAGRQGDPGKSKFYLSLDDDLMRIFGGVNIKRFMEDDLPIEHAWINKAIANAQRKVEAHNYDIRKHLLEYDDVMNQQRKVVYSMRKEVLGRGNLSDMVFSMIEELAAAIANDFFPGGKLKKTDGQPHLDLVELNNAVNSMLALPVHIAEKDILPFNDQGLKKLIVAKAEEHYRTREKEIGEASFRDVEKMILLSTIDHLWKDHLLAMDSLREGIGLQGYGQKDPLVEYKKQAFRFFEMMMNLITTDVVRKTLTVQVQSTPRFQFEELSDLQYNVDESGELVGGKPMPGVAPLVGTGEAAAQAIPAGGFQLPPGARIEIEGLPPGVTFDDLDPATQQQILQMMAQQGLLGQLQQQAAGRGGGSAPRPSGGPTAAPKRSEAADFLGSAVQGIGADAKKPVAANPYPGANRNDPCPCGSGKKYKKCHGAGS